jgi:DNA-binding HxlR family transcriptional regulator
MEEVRNVPPRTTMGLGYTKTAAKVRAPIDPTISAKLVKVYQTTRQKVAEQLAQGGRSGRKLRRATDAVMRKVLRAQVKRVEAAKLRAAKDAEAKATTDLASLTPEERASLAEALDSGALDAL